MSFLRQKSSSAAVAPAYTGMQIQTSSGALPIAILWGVNQLAPNVIWSGNFRAVPQYAQTSGKGGGGGKTATGYDYRTAVMMALCEGPVAGVGTIWNGQTASTLASLGLTFFSGGTPQPAWSYLSAALPAQALSYNGTAYICSADYDMGASADIGALTIEVEGVLAASSQINEFDADPALIIQDFLTNPQYGVGFPAASVDARSLLGPDPSCYQIYCQAAGLALSPALVNQETASSILTRWLQLTNSAAVWSGGLLKFVPYGDAALFGSLRSGASVAFAPNLTPVYDLDDDDFVTGEDEDPIAAARTDPSAAYNMQTLEISQRSNQYDATPIAAFDQNAIENFSPRIAPTITAHEICDPAVAQIAAQLILQRGLYVRNAYTFKLSWEYCLLEPMDLVTVTDSALGVVKAAVRILDVEEDEEGVLTITAEEFPGGAATAATYPVQTGASAPVDRGLSPAPVNAPVIFEPPAALTGGEAEIWIAASGGRSGLSDRNWGGALVWISTDDAGYAQIGQIDAPARQGVLSASLASFATAGPDAHDTLAVDMAQSNGVLSGATPSDARNGLTLSLVDHELLAYGAVALTGPNAYALTNLQRGLYGSTPAPHAVGASFVRLDQAIFKYPLPAALVGQTLYLKLQSFNIFGAAAQDLSTCVAYSFTPRGSGALVPVAQALAVGSALDYGLSSGSISEIDDFGLASDPYVTVVDLGLASG